MTKAQLKKTIDKEIRAMRGRITSIVRDRIADQIIDDLGDETGELMGKLTVDFVDDPKLTDYAYNDSGNGLKNLPQKQKGTADLLPTLTENPKGFQLWRTGCPFQSATGL